MINIECEHVNGFLNQEDLVYWLFGFHGELPGILNLGKVSIGKSNEQNANELYAISLNSRDAELSSPWILPWASGLAAGHGVDLRGMLGHDNSGRARRMQALILCHRSGWLTYYGVRTKE